LGVCTSLLSLCRRCSSSFGGCSRSTSPIEMCALRTAGSERLSHAAVQQPNRTGAPRPGRAAAHMAAEALALRRRRG
jgi:hypothetical protein